ncbi:MAG: hypothetical protein RH862_04370 [Leptospiraceae bacterium]
MEYIEKDSEIKVRATKGLYRMVLVSGIAFCVIASLNLMGWLAQMEKAPYGWLTMLFFLIPGVSLVWAYYKREEKNLLSHRIIRISGIWIAMSLFAFPSTLSQSPVAGLLVVAVFTLGLALFFSSNRFRNNT